MPNSFDVVIIGGGPGGYVAAIKAAQLGMKVACVEKRNRLGGTCLNVGCMPSKALLYSTEKYYEAKNHFAECGVICTEVSYDLDKMMRRKERIITELGKGIGFLFDKNKIFHIHGTATIEDVGQVAVTRNDGEQTKLYCKNIVIATGSEVMPVPGVEVDETNIVTSSGILSLTKVPNTMLVIGGGYIGLEMGSVWSRLGTKVTVVEYTSDILPNVDKEIAKNCQKIFEKRGMNFKLETKLVKAQKNEHDKVDVLLENAKNSAQEPWEVDVVLLAVGRKPYTEGLNLDKLGVNRTSRGQIEVDRHFQTSVNGIYAIGDVIVGPMLAHKAEEEGVAIAEILAGQAGHVNYDLIPGVIYTSPEVATIGKNEQELQARNIPYNTGKFPLTANSRAKAIGHTDGMVKVITCKETDRILGVHIIGPDAGTLIAEVVIAMEYGASAEDIARTCHAHPTLNEAVKEAALAAFVKAIHL